MTHLLRLVAYEYRRPGKGSRFYEEWLLVDRPDLKVLLHDPYLGPSVEVRDEVVLDPGAPIVWFVFPGRWYDIGRFHRADGSHTGWYTNLCRPPVTHGERWLGEDLFLDLWQAPGSDPVWLDDDELAAAATLGLLDSATLRRVATERRAIERSIASGAWPPPVAVDFDLREARRRLRR